MQKDEAPGGGRERLKTRQEQSGTGSTSRPASQDMDVESDGVGGTKRKAQGDLDEEADRSKEPGERSDGNAGVISEETTTNVDLNSGMSIEQMMQVFGVETEDGQDKEYLNMIHAGMSKRANPGVALDLRTDCVSPRTGMQRQCGST